MEETFNDRLKIRVKESGLTQKSFAAKAHITEAAASKYLSGAREPHLQALVSIAKALETSPNALLGFSQPSKDDYASLALIIREKKSCLSSEERMRLIMLLSQQD